MGTINPQSWQQRKRTQITNDLRMGKRYAGDWVGSFRDVHAETNSFVVSGRVLGQRYGDSVSYCISWPMRRCIISFALPR
jgi:hypothetical protein